MSDINVTHKTRNLGLFNFKAFLNLGMLLKESEKARILVAEILRLFQQQVDKMSIGGSNPSWVILLASLIYPSLLNAHKKLKDLELIEQLMHKD